MHVRFKFIHFVLLFDHFVSELGAFFTILQGDTFRLLLFALLFELVEELATLCELYFADQIDDADGVDLTKDSLDELLSQIRPILHLVSRRQTLRAFFRLSARLFQLEVLLNLLGYEANLLWQILK